MPSAHEGDMNSSEKDEKIAELLASGCSENQITKIMNVSKSRVSNVRKQVVGQGYDPSEHQLTEKPREKEKFLEPDYENIAHELTRKHVTQQLLWEEYFAAASQSGMNAYHITQFKVHLKEYLDGSAFGEVISHKPGEQAEVDWVGDPAIWYDPDTGEVKKAWMFCAVLAFSGLAYAEVVPDMKIPNWIMVNVHMMEYFHGAPLILTLDNLKTGVISHPRNGDVIYQQDYEAFGNHYGTILSAARVRTPKNKPLAENFAGNCETYILSRMRNIKCYSIEEYNHHMWAVLESFNNKPYQKKDGSRRSVYEEYERAALRPLPDHPYEYHIFKRLMVQNNCFISYNKNYYSVPYRFIGTRVDALIYATRIEIWLSGNKICEHNLVTTGKGKYIYDSSHFPKESSRYGDWNSERFKRWAYKVGPYAYELTCKIFTLRPEQVYYQRINTILCLTNSYPAERVNNACAIAMKNAKYPTSKLVRGILENNLDLAVHTEEKPRESEKAYVRGVQYYEK